MDHLSTFGRIDVFMMSLCLQCIPGPSSNSKWVSGGGINSPKGSKSRCSNG
uniref:Uncharacterized protein n=1 Tax=Setaria italica TaxID=4555 RepID=K3YBN6_SETIT